MAKYYYNGILLPEIPADVLGEYPMCLVYLRSDGQNFRLLAGTKTWFVNDSIRIESSTYVVYGATAESESWTYETQYTDDGNFGLGNGIKWSNHDIPNGSATSSSLYFPSTCLVPETPTGKYYYNDILLPAIPNDVLMQYPNVCMYQWLSNGVIDVLCAPSRYVWFLKSNTSIDVKKCTYVLHRYNPESDKWEYRISYTDGGGFNIGKGTVIWSNHDIRNGSSLTDTIYFNCSEPVPLASAFGSKYLIQSGGSLFTVTDGVLTAVEGSVNAELFRTYGMDEIPSSDLLVTLTDPVVYHWTNKDEIIPLVAVVQGVPFPQTLESEDYDMTDETILGIETVIVDASDDVRFAISFDSGQTWKLHTGESWATLSEGDTGMSPSILSAITTEDWNAEATTGKFRFRVTLSTVDDYLNSLVVDYLN